MKAGAVALSASEPPAVEALPEPVRLASIRAALLFGNVVIGCGVMVVIGTLNDIATSLHVSVAIAGQLVAIAAAVMFLGAPLLAGWANGLDRRKLLAAALAWYAVGHALCALAPGYAWLWPVRALTVLGAAVFTPQAAAAIGALAPPAERGRSITFIFIGWSIASVLGIPLAAWVGDVFGWRVAFFAIAALGAVGAAWVWVTMPDGVRPATLTLAAWRGVFSSPVLMAVVVVTALSGAGQFTIFSYIAPYFKQVLGAGTVAATLLFALFGIAGVVGNAVASRYVDRIGAGRAVAFALLAMTVSLLLWPWAGGFIAMSLVLVPWGLGCFSSNSMQQARLNGIAPALAPATLALNSSAIYLGQAAGASSGGWLIAQHGFGALAPIALAWMIAALLLSLWAGRAAWRTR